MRDRDDRAVERGEGVLQRLGAVDVEVVGGLVEQQQRGAAGFQQQDLHPGLLPARKGLEALFRLVRQLVAGQRAHGGVQGQVRVGEDLHGRAAQPVGMGVGLREVAGHDARAQPAGAGVRDRRRWLGQAAAVGQQPQEMGLTAAIAAEHGDPLAVEDLHAERLHQPGQLQVAAGDGAYAGAPTGQFHPHVGAARQLLRRTGLLELAQPGPHGPVAAGHIGGVGRLLAQPLDQLAQPVQLLLPPAVQLLDARPPRLTRFVVRAEASPVRPRGAALDGDHRAGRAGQQLPVVADQQHRLRRLSQPLLQPALTGHVEVVVRFVQQQHLVVAAQQRLQRQPLLLPAGQRGQVAVPHPVVRRAERRRGAHVPPHLGVVPAGVAPGGERGRVPELGGLVAAGQHRLLGGGKLAGGRAQRRRRHLHQQVADRTAVPDGADELAHHAQAAGAGHAALGRRDITGDDAQQGRLPRTIGADQRADVPLAHPERNVVQQRPPVGQHIRHPRHVDVPHDGLLPVLRGDGRRPGGRRSSDFPVGHFRGLAMCGLPRSPYG